MSTGASQEGIYDLLLKLNRQVGETGQKVESMHTELLGENGHIARIDRHLERLYKRTEELGKKDNELEKKITESAKPARYAIERGRAIWIFLGGVLVLVDVLVHVATFMKGPGH